MLGTLRGQHCKTWLGGVTAGTLAVSFGMQWLMLHLVALGFTVLLDEPDTALLKSPSALMENHQNCPVCISLSEQEQQSGDSESTVLPQLSKIEGTAFYRVLVFGPYRFSVTHLSLPADPGWQTNPSKLHKPPQATA